MVILHARISDLHASLQAWVHTLLPLAHSGPYTGRMSPPLLGNDLAVAHNFRGDNMKSEANNEKYLLFSSLMGPMLRCFTGISFTDFPALSNDCRSTSTNLDVTLQGVWILPRSNMVLLSFY